MAIVTLLTDHGTQDYYTASIKASILSVNPGLNVVDISHNIRPHDIAHAAYVIKAVYHDFPKGTVHLISVNDNYSKTARHICVQLEGHFFVAPDNGVVSLIAEKEPSFITELFMLNDENRNFVAKTVYAKAAAMLASGSGLEAVGKFTKTYERKIGRKFRATKRQISGNVINIDNYGNLITNIEAEVFDIIQKGRAFEVHVGRESISMINKSPADVDDGDCFVIFNELGYLEIGINKGRADELLGVNLDAPVSINFEEA